MAKMPVYDFKKHEYNQTYNDSVHKYTLNLPLGLFEKAQKKAREAGIYRVSIYFRAIIEREINGTTELGINEILSAKKESNRVASAEHRREHLEKLYAPRRGIAWLIEKMQPKQQKFDF